MSIDPDRTIGLSRHADLKTRREGEVLVLPERAIRIGGSGAEILRLFSREERKTPSQVVAEMRVRYPDDAAVEGEVIRFLAEMLELGALVEDRDEGC